MTARSSPSIHCSTMRAHMHQSAYALRAYLGSAIVLPNAVFLTPSAATAPTRLPSHTNRLRSSTNGSATSSYPRVSTFPEVSRFHNQYIQFQTTHSTRRIPWQRPAPSGREGLLRPGAAVWKPARAGGQPSGNPRAASGRGNLGSASVIYIIIKPVPLNGASRARADAGTPLFPTQEP
jgi:hypothetical protein